MMFLMLLPMIPLVIFLFLAVAWSIAWPLLLVIFVIWLLCRLARR